MQQHETRQASAFTASSKRGLCLRELCPWVPVSFQQHRAHLEAQTEDDGLALPQALHRSPVPAWKRDRAGHSPGITGTAAPRLGELSSVQVAWKIRLCLQEVLGKSKAKNRRKLKFIILSVWGFFYHLARARVAAGSPGPTSPWSSFRSHCGCSRTAVEWCER